ncbi:MAG TPA: helix-turn-helix domain-containing protein [Alphaproteobacteria bacterium]|jgi:AraC-like DNA-binding protein|nr:helix-turn-helix domain-containing protein [Alphaproteobacteria bacterium]
MKKMLDPASHTGRATVGTIVSRTTDSVPAAERLDFWRDGVMKRLRPEANAPEGGAFRARLSRVQGDGAELIDVASDGWTARRDRARCRRDGVDDISFDLLASGASAHRIGEAERHLRPGDLTLVDSAQPTDWLRGRHRVISLIIPRDRLQVPAKFPFSLQTQGIAALLKSHLLLTADRAADLSPEQRVLAIRVAADLAMAVLLTAQEGGFDADRFGIGLYEGALSLVAKECVDPEFGPRQLASVLNCSRATLYRAFSARGGSVADTIWKARLERAHLMLVSPRHAGLTIGEIAFRSGFVEHPTFNRMFKRRYGMTPQEARQSHLATAAAS